MTHTFELPLPQNLNRNRHTAWQAAHAAKRKWYALADAWGLRYRHPSPPAQPWRLIRVTAVLTMRASMDPENAMRRASKWPMDWLVSRGYLVDDRAKHVRWTGLPEQRISHAWEPGLRLEVTPDDAWIQRESDARAVLKAQHAGRWQFLSDGEVEDVGRDDPLRIWQFRRVGSADIAIVTATGAVKLVAAA